MGGQTALKLAEKLDRYGIKVLGTSYQSLDLAEDRGSFSTLLKENNIPYPEFDTAETADQALKVADKLNFPILVRPSYVLGGQGMKIVINKEDLESHVVDLLRKILAVRETTSQAQYDSSATDGGEGSKADGRNRGTVFLEQGTREFGHFYTYPF